jgi:hypothetical protein
MSAQRNRLRTQQMEGENLMTAASVAGPAAPASVAGPGAANASKKPRKKKDVDVAAPAAGKLLPNTVTSVPEGAFAVETTGLVSAEPPDMSVADQKDSGIRFCQVCSNYLYLQVDGETQTLFRLCRNCGFKGESEQGGLVTEMVVQQRSAEGFNMINEFTIRDPRLPHIHKIMKCINPECDSNHGKKDSDVVYIKYDLANLRYIYMCYLCESVWKSRR